MFRSWSSTETSEWSGGDDEDETNTYSRWSALSTKDMSRRRRCAEDGDWRNKLIKTGEEITEYQNCETHIDLVTSFAGNLARISINRSSVRFSRPHGLESGLTMTLLLFLGLSNSSAVDLISFFISPFTAARRKEHPIAFDWSVPEPRSSFSPFLICFLCQFQPKSDHKYRRMYFYSYIQKHIVSYPKYIGE